MTVSSISCERAGGTFTTSLRGYGAEQLAAMAIQQKTFNLQLEGGPSLTLRVCDGECLNAEPNIHKTNTSGIVGGVVAIVVLVVVVIVVGGLTFLIRHR